MLPSIVGPISEYNAEGKYIVHKDKPMEKAYQMIEWHWTEYHGRYKVEQSDIRDHLIIVTQGHFLEPPSIELLISQNTDGLRYIVGPLLEVSPEDERTALHVVNLFLEAF